MEEDQKWLSSQKLDPRFAGWKTNARDPNTNVLFSHAQHTAASDLVRLHRPVVIRLSAEARWRLPRRSPYLDVTTLWYRAPGQYRSWMEAATALSKPR